MCYQFFKKIVLFKEKSRKEQLEQKFFIERQILVLWGDEKY